MSMTVLLKITLRERNDDAEQIIRDTLTQTAAFEGNERLQVLVDDDDPRRAPRGSPQSLRRG